MISFRFKNQVKRVKIKTKQRLDERMSHWLQKVFCFKNQIIGFKSQDNRVYDVESFYNSIERFFNSNVDIIEAGDQLQISFTSENLNSSSFIRPSQPSEINHKEPSSDEYEDFITVSDRKSFEKKLQDGKDISLLFDINAVYRKTLSEECRNLLNSNYNFKINLYMYINNSHPKKSCLSIYIGRSCVITFPLIKNYMDKIKTFLNRYKGSAVLAERENKQFLQAKASHQQEDEAPSFTTYHLQERLNQETCIDYLTKMYRQQKLLRIYEYSKLIEKCEENFSEFYRIFCEGVMDNDFESFKNEILHKVENNLELILSNVDEMDLSRPISREQQRRNNLKKSVPEIEIVKVENYFEILDQLKSEINSEGVNEIKQLLLDEDEEISGFFSKYLSRQFNQETLAFKLNNALSKRKNDRSRPNSRYFPSRPIKSKSVDPVRRKFSQENGEEAKFNIIEPQNNNVEEPPMFGSIRNQENFSPIKYMSDIESNYKQAWNKLSEKADEFEAEEYGLLYYYLQKRDDSISNFIQQLEWNDTQSIANIKKMLKEKIHSIFLENFTPAEISFLETIRHNQNVNCIYENFKYESDLTSFISGLKEALEKNKPFGSEIKILHKKSSDSQLLENKDRKNNRYGRRKFSDQNLINMDPRSPSPKDSEYSLYNKNSSIPDFIEILKAQWHSEFEDMIKEIDFSEERKEDLIRELYRSGNAKIFGWVRNYMKGHSQYFGSQEIYELKENQRDLKFLLSILPIYDEFLKLFVQDGLLTEKIRKWIVSQVLSQNMTVIAAFELYLETKEEEDFVETLRIIYESQNKDMEFYNTYIKRLEALLKEMSINDEVGLEVFSQFPNVIKGICELYFITGNLDDMMDTLEVLYHKQNELRNLKVATLNFSGINLNPFEYHDGSEEYDKLNALFIKNLQKERPGLKNWKIGKIDKEVHKRMSVCFTEGFQLCKDGKLPNRAEFAEIWMNTFPSNQNIKNPSTKEEKEQCIVLDYLIYLTVLQYVYGFEEKGISIQSFESTIKEYDPKDMLSYLEEKKSKPQCKVQIKLQRVLEYLLKNNIDVLFLQEGSSADWADDLVKEYACVKNSDSLIIYKKEKIGTIKQNLHDQYAQKLNFNNDTVFAFSDKGYLLISAHLKSSKENIRQAKEMFQTLDKIMADHPMLKLIVGIDANHFIKSEDIPKSLKLMIIPETEQIPTSMKKRTFLQAQYSKSDLEVSEVKDSVFTNRMITNYSIQTVEGKEVRKDSEKKEYIPNSEHPYDHFIVIADIV